MRSWAMVKRVHLRNRWLELVSAVANLITAKVEVAVFTASDGTKPESSRFEASGVAKTTA